jgi:pimeloyl-ACP methyl ester carboxylesterase
MTATVGVSWEDGIAAQGTTSSGEPVLWLHGYTMDATVWEELWNRLPDRRHIGVDLPGHGRSRALRPQDDLRSVAADLGRVSLACGVRSLVALSFGSLMALEIAACYPAGFDRIVLAAPSFGGGPTDRHAQRMNQELMRLFREKGPGPWMTKLWMTSPPDIFTGAAKNPDLWRRLLELVERHRWQELLDGKMQRFTGFRQSERQLMAIQADVLVVLGEHDMPAFRRAGQILARTLPRCRVHYMPNTGHLCLLEAPAAAAALIAEHLEKK